MRWRTLLPIALLCTFCFGGSFTCYYDSDDDDGPVTRPIAVHVNSAP